MSANLAPAIRGTPEWKTRVGEGVKRGKHRPRKDATCGHGGKAKALGLCESCYRHDYYKRNEEKEVKRAKVWATDPGNRERVLASKRKYNNKPEVLVRAKEYKKTYRQTHRETVHADNRKYRARLREQNVFADFKKWWEENFFDHGGANSLSRYRLALFAFQSGYELKKKPKKK